MASDDDLPTPAMQRMDLRVIGLKSEAMAWKGRAERAEVENTRLRDALKAIAERYAQLAGNEPVSSIHAARWMKEQARAALDGTTETTA